MQRWYEKSRFSTNISLYLATDALLWKANRQPQSAPKLSIRMVLVRMIFSDLFKVTIIQRQITWKWYNIQLYLQWPTNKSRMIYRTAPFSMTLNDPYPQFIGHAFLWRWISQKRYDIGYKRSFNELPACILSPYIVLLLNRRFMIFIAYSYDVLSPYLWKTKYRPIIVYWLWACSYK